MGEPSLAGRAYSAEEHLCSFERTWNADRPIDFGEYLPESDHPELLAALTELVRVDMEFCWNAGVNRTAAEYFAQYPELINDHQSRSSIAFEEFRLRNINKEQVHPETIASKYDVCMLDWPDVDFSNGVSTVKKSDLTTQRLCRASVPKPGDRFENFRIIGRLGEGAFGTVMLAQQDDLAGRFTVLKFVPAVSNEHDFLARLQHTNIVPVFSIHGTDEFKAICMPFMGVVTLQDLNHSLDASDNLDSRWSVQRQALVRTINRSKEQTVESSIPDSKDLQKFQRRSRSRMKPNVDAESQNFLAFAVEIMAAVADGLGFAHDRGIVHGDLKPANVLLDDDQNPIILDFHLANSASEGLGSHVGGTLAYMAPEHLEALNSDQPVDSRTDIYSAGVMLFELATGALPFAIQNSLEEIKRCRMHPVVLSHQDRKFLGPDLVAIVAKCLAPDPDARYQNGYELAADLRAYQEDAPLVHAAERNWMHRSRKWCRRHPRITSISTVSIAATLLTALLISWLLRLNHEMRIANAVSASEDFVTAVDVARIPLTALVLDDKQHFVKAIKSANDVLSVGGWQDGLAADATERHDLLNASMLATEQRSVGELHFWIAAGYLRNLRLSTDPDERDSLLAQALAFNRSAKTILGADEFIGIDAQKSRILALQRGEEFEFVPDWSKLKDANRSDKVMVAFLGRRDHQNALKALLQVVEEDPMDFLAWMQLGQNYYAVNKHELAQACFSLCIGLDPDNSYPRLFRAMSIIKAKRGRIETAIDDLDAANQLSPNSLPVIQNLGLAYGMKGEYTKAKKYYDDAIALGTHETRTWFLRSRINKLLGNQDQAAADVQYFMQTDPVDLVSWRTRGTEKIGSDPEGAVQDLQQALELNANDIVALNNLSHVYSEKLNDLPQAIDVLDQIVKLQPLIVRHRATRGVLHARTGQRDAALRDARHCLKQDNSADTCYRIAGLYAQTSKLDPGDAKVALNLLRQAVAKSPPLVARMMKTDPDLEPIKGHQDFKELLDMLEKLGFEKPS